MQLIRPSDYGIDFYGDSLFTSEAEAREHPEQVDAMRRAILRGWHYALEKPEDIIRWLLANQPDATGDETESRLRAEAAEIAALINANLISIGHINPERWSRLADLVVRIGLVPNAERLRGFVYLGPVDQVPGLGQAALRNFRPRALRSPSSAFSPTAACSAWWIAAPANCGNPSWSSANSSTWPRPRS